MRKQRFMDQSMFICPKCGGQFPLMRNHGQHRKRGHIKDIWCPYCKKDQKFTEISHRDYAITAHGTIYM